jgi:transposase
MLRRMAAESGIETPTADDLTRLDRSRKGKKLSNADWESPTDPDAKIARMKDGRTHLAYKPEHAVDLDTGAVVAAEMHQADQGDTTTLPQTLASAATHLAGVDTAPTPEHPAELVADKGYHSRAGLKELENGPWKSRVAEPRRDGFLRWHGDNAARRGVYNNRARLLSEVARQAFKLRAELVERGFALILDRGGMRRAWLRGRENLHKRYLIHVAGYNLGLIMRLLTGAGTPRGSRASVSAWLYAVVAADGGFISLLVAIAGDQIAALAVEARKVGQPFERWLAAEAAVIAVGVVGHEPGLERFGALG